MIPETDSMRQKRSDPRSTEQLIQFALNEADDDAAWEPVMVLHFRATSEVLETAKRLCIGAAPRERKLGADILGQLGVPDRAFPDECFHTLARMVTDETDSEVLESIGIAFGHLHDIRAVELLAPLRHHISADVRLGVVHGISRQEDALAISVLIELSRDEDYEVRDWATFGLGSMIETDSPEIREALIARLADTNDDAKGEALVGLARRKDDRVLDPLLDELTSENVGLLAVEAAEDLGDPRLVPALMALKDGWRDEEDTHTKRLDSALLSCSPKGGS